MDCIILQWPYIAHTLHNLYYHGIIVLIEKIYTNYMCTIVVLWNTWAYTRAGLSVEWVECRDRGGTPLHRLQYLLVNCTFIIPVMLRIGRLDRRCRSGIKPRWDFRKFRLRNHSSSGVWVNPTRTLDDARYHISQWLDIKNYRFTLPGIFIKRYSNFIDNANIHVKDSVNKTTLSTWL